MASDPATTLTAGPLAPSEMVLLYAERFTTAQILLGRTGDPQVPLLHADMTVSAPQLGRAILAVAFLANDRAGSIRLDPRQKTKLFGLSSVDTLFADPLENKAAWPVSSLESRVLAVAQRLFDDKEQHEVVTIITELLPMSPEPWAAVTGLVIQGLGDRGLLDDRSHSLDMDAVKGAPFSYGGFTGQALFSACPRLSGSSLSQRGAG